MELETPIEQKQEVTYNKIFLSKFDQFDIKVLGKFLLNDSYVFSILYRELVEEGFEIHSETLRKRLKKLKEKELLTEIEHSNPRCYQVNYNAVGLIKKIIKDFSTIIGLDKVLL